MNSFPKSFWDQVDYMLKAAGIKNLRRKEELCDALLNRPGAGDAPVYYHIVSHCSTLHTD